MAFKMKGYPMQKGTASHREASAAFQKATYQSGQGRNVSSNTNNQGGQTATSPVMKKAPYKKGTYEEAIKKDSELPEYIKLQKSLKKGSPEWNKNQNKINKAYGDPTRHNEGGASNVKTKAPDKTDPGKKGEVDKSVERTNKVTGNKVVKTKDKDEYGNVDKSRAKYDKDGNLIKSRDVEKTGKETEDKTDDKKEKDVTRRSGKRVQVSKGTDVGGEEGVKKSKTVTTAEGDTKTKKTYTVKYKREQREKYRDAVKAWRDGGKKGDKPEKSKYYDWKN